MAIVQNTLIGRAKRSVGNTTFSTLYGQNILKSKPIEVRDAKTELQLKYRALFAYCVGFAKWLNYSLAVRKRYAGNSSLYPSAPFPFIVKDLNKQKITAISTPSINWEAVVLGVGQIPPQEGMVTVAHSTGHTATTTWPALVVGNQTLNDNMSIVALNYTKQEGYLIDNAAVRGDETLTWGFPETWETNDDLAIFTMFDGYNSNLIDAAICHTANIVV